MPNKPSFSRSTALKARPDRKTLIIAAAVLLALGLLIFAIAAHGGSKTAEEPRASQAPEVPAASAPEVPEAAAPAPEATPQAAELVPPDASGLIKARAVQRRDGFPMLSWDVDAFSLDARGRMSYAGAQTLTGIDVSEHQGEINWKKVAADGVDFAMIRLGYRGSTQGGLYLDEYFKRNIAAATAAGLKVGVYFFSQAIDPREAAEEAAFVLENLEGYTVTFPVVFDWEIVGGSAARTYSVSRRTLVECTRAFCEAVRDKGYTPMIYFTRYLGYRKYILRNLTDYGFWYAEYDSQPRFAFDFDMWQYSETGKVSGVDGNVDLNIWFVR